MEKKREEPILRIFPPVVFSIILLEIVQFDVHFCMFYHLLQCVCVWLTECVCFVVYLCGWLRVCVLVQASFELCVHTRTRTHLHMLVFSRFWQSKKVEANCVENNRLNNQKFFLRKENFNPLQKKKK